MHKHNKKLYLKILLVAVSLFSATLLSPASATNFCTSEACIAAEKAEAEAKARSEEASSIANTYEAAVYQLSLEIAELEAQITKLEAEQADIEKLIVLNEQKLSQQQTALAKLIVEMHFESSSDALLVIAGSSSISDVAEKEARTETIEAQVTASAKEIKATKAELEQQKISIEISISTIDSSRQEISRKRAEQQTLVNKYKNDAAAYAAESEARLKEKEAEIEAARQEYIASLGRASVIVDPGLNSYPYASKCPGLNWRYTGDESAGQYGGLYCECTSYAGYKAYEYWGYSINWRGNAVYWASRAREKGLTVTTTPEAKTVGVSTKMSVYGHVVWIEKVNSDGTIDYSEYNGNRVANFSYVKGAPASKFQYYIHFD